MRVILRLVLLFTLALSLFSSRVVVSAQQQTQQCTVCADGSKPNGSIGSTDCSLIEESIGLTPESDPECGRVRLQGFMHCSCPTLPVEQYCSMCDYSSSNSSSTSNSSSSYQALQYQTATIPTLNDISCQEAEFLPADDERCGSSALSEAAWFCGCPAATALPRGQCSLCGSNATTSLPNDRPLPPPFETKTCAQVDREGGLYYDVVDTTTCEALLLGDQLPTQFDYPSYCGCVRDAEVPNACGLCGADQSVQNPDATLNSSSTSSRSMTCAELEMATPYVLDTDYCQSLQDDYADLCCNPPSPTTTSDATTAPLPADASNNNSSSSGGDAAPPADAPVSSPTTPSSSTVRVGRLSSWVVGAMIGIVVAAAVEHPSFVLLL